MSNPTLLKNVQEKAQQLLEQEYVGISDNEMFNYLNKRLGRHVNFWGTSLGLMRKLYEGMKVL